MKNLLFALALLDVAVLGFTPALHHRSLRSTCSLSMDPSALLGGGAVEMSSLVAVAVGAATGAAAQQPRIQQLEKELAAARLALSESENVMSDKMQALEEKLFEMDQEYEAQTARFKRQYDSKMKEELERTTEKIKQEYEFKLDIRVNQERSAMLSEELDKLSGSVDQAGELSTLRLKQDQIEKANMKLEKALADSETELNRMKEAASKKKLFGLF